MWPQIVFRVVLLFFCIGFSFNKRHKKYRWKDNYRGSTLASLENNCNDLQSRDIYSFTKRKPIVLDLKKALDPNGFSKWLANLSINQKVEEFPISSKSNSEKKFVHISQTEYPQIFHTQKCNIFGTKTVTDNIFYPFKNFTITSLNLLDPDLIKIKLQDRSGNQENFEETGLKTSPVKKVKPIKVSKDARSYEKPIKQEPKDDVIVSTTDTSNGESESLIVTFFNNGNKIKNSENEIFEKSNIGFNKNQILTIPNSLRYYESIINEETSSSAFHAENTSVATNHENPMESPSSVVTSTSKSDFVTQRLNKKMVPYISGTLDPRRSLNLQISLTLTVNNDSYSLIPTQ